MSKSRPPSAVFMIPQVFEPPHHIILGSELATLDNILSGFESIKQMLISADGLNYEGDGRPDAVTGYSIRIKNSRMLLKWTTWCMTNLHARIVTTE